MIGFYDLIEYSSISSRRENERILKVHYNYKNNAVFTMQKWRTPMRNYASYASYVRHFSVARIFNVSLLSISPCVKLTFLKMNETSLNNVNARVSSLLSESRSEIKLKAASSIAKRNTKICVKRLGNECWNLCNYRVRRVYKFSGDRRQPAAKIYFVIKLSGYEKLQSLCCSCIKWQRKTLAP